MQIIIQNNYSLEGLYIIRFLDLYREYYNYYSFHSCMLYLKFINMKYEIKILCEDTLRSNGLR